MASVSADWTEDLEWVRGFRDNRHSPLIAYCVIEPPSPASGEGAITSTVYEGHFSSRLREEERVT